MTQWLSNLRVRFLGLVLVAVLPALGLLILSANEQRDRAIENAQAQNRRLAELLSAEQGRVIESTRQLLVVLSRLPEVRSAGPTCPSLLATLNAEFPVYDNLGVIGRDGDLVCSAVDPGGPVNYGDQPFVRTTIDTGQFIVGEYQPGRVTGNPVLSCGFPVLDPEGTVVGVVYAAIDLTRLAADFAADALEPNAVLTVFDRDGTALLRQPPLEGFVGQPLSATPVVATVLAEGAGVTTQHENGVRYVYAYTPLGGPDTSSAYLTIAEPEADVVAPAEQAFSENLTRLGLVVVVILIGSWVAADLLIRRDSDSYKVLVRRVYDAFGSGSVDLLDEVVAVDFRDHDPMPGQAEGLAGLKQAVSLFRVAFPDGEMLVDDMVAEGNKVVSRVTLRGTQRGDFFGLPASGRIVSAEGIEIYRIDKGKIVEGWSRFVPPLLEADDDEQPPTEPPAPTAKPPELTLGSVASALGGAVRRRLSSATATAPGDGQRT